jgi:anti-sigma-K factor RskA
MVDRDHDDIKSLIAPYSLGALPEDEIRFVRAHILECEECMAEADDYFEVASSLSMTVADVEPPVGFSDRVVARATESRTATTAPQRRRLWVSAPALAAGVMLLAIILLAVMVIDTRGDLAQNEKALAVLLDSDRGVELRGDERGVARLVPTEDGSTLVVAGLSRAPEGRTYQLWFLGADIEPVSAAVFDVSGDLSVIETDLRFEDFTGAAVSIEPGGGSKTPTGEIVVSST